MSIEAGEDQYMPQISRLGGAGSALRADALMELHERGIFLDTFSTWRANYEVKAEPLMALMDSLT